MNPRPGRHRAAWLGAAVPAALSIATAGCVDDGGPRVDRATPAAARPGAIIELVGERFCADQTGPRCALAVAGYVDFGRNPPMLRGLISTWTDTRIEVAVPASAAAGGTDIIVTVDGRSSNAVDFEVQ